MRGGGWLDHFLGSKKMIAAPAAHQAQRVPIYHHYSHTDWATGQTCEFTDFVGEVDMPPITERTNRSAKSALTLAARAVLMRLPYIAALGGALFLAYSILK